LVGSKSVLRADGLHAQRPRRRSSSRGVPRPAVARQYAGERAADASRMEQILAPGHGGTSPNPTCQFAYRARFAMHSTEGWHTDYATTRAKTKPSATSDSGDSSERWPGKALRSAS